MVFSILLSLLREGSSDDAIQMHSHHGGTQGEILTSLTEDGCVESHFLLL